jgi:hypothetical protein
MTDDIAFPESWDFTPEQRDVLQQTFDQDPVAAMSAIAHAAGQVAFQQAASLSGSQTENFRHTVFNQNLERATSEIYAAVGDNYSEALPEIEQLWQQDPSIFGDGQSYEVVRDRLAMLYNSTEAAQRSDTGNSRKAAEDRAAWDRIKNAPGTRSYQQLAIEQGR